MSDAASVRDRKARMRKYVKIHPDFVGIRRSRASFENWEENDVVTALPIQLDETPEYLEAQSEDMVSRNS
jgi:hypothetical protein